MEKISKLQRTLKNDEGIYISNPQNILYLSNFAEFTDKMGRLFITKNSAYLFFSNTEAHQAPVIFKPIRVLITWDHKKDLKKILKEKKIKKILIESKDLSVYESDKLKRLQKGIKIKKTIDLVEGLRKIKDIGEVKKIKKACSLTDRACGFIKKRIKAGQTEKEVANLIDDFVRKNGGETAFPTIVASGPNSANIHHKPTSRKIKKGEPIVLDFGAKVENYCSDLTRTVFLGKPPREFKEIYNLVLKSQTEALNLLKKERDSIKIDKASRKVITDGGYENFPHGLGHSIGLEVHEYPKLSWLKYTLRKGNVLTVEPGIYLKGKGGVRTEDDILIKNKGIEILTKSPKELQDVVIR